MNTVSSNMTELEHDADVLRQILGGASCRIGAIPSHDSYCAQIIVDGYPIIVVTREWLNDVPRDKRAAYYQTGDFQKRLADMPVDNVLVVSNDGSYYITQEEFSSCNAPWKASPRS